MKAIPLKYLVLFFTITFASVCVAADASDGTLLLRVTLHREPCPGGTFEGFIRATLTNVSEKTIIVPTTSYDGRPCCWFNGPDSRGISYIIGFQYSPDRAVFKPSPLRFFPVTLKPGESTELPEYSIGSSSVSEVSVGFSVEARYGAEQGWWTGSLHATNQEQIKRS